MVYAKIRREARFAVPEMADVRDTCATNSITSRPTRRWTRSSGSSQDFAADIAIWGSVERAAGTEGEIYDMVIKCVDFSVQPAQGALRSPPAPTPPPKSRTSTPRTMDSSTTASRAGRAAGRGGRGGLEGESQPDRRRRLRARQPRRAPRLGARGGQQREPLGNLVKWVDEKGNPDNQVIRFDIPTSPSPRRWRDVLQRLLPRPGRPKYRFQSAIAPPVLAQGLHQVLRRDGLGLSRRRALPVTSPPPAPCSAARSTAASRTSRARRTPGTRRPRTSLPSTPSTIPMGQRELYGYLSPG